MLQKYWEGIIIQYKYAYLISYLNKFPEVSIKKESIVFILDKVAITGWHANNSKMQTLQL